MNHIDDPSTLLSHGVKYELSNDSIYTTVPSYFCLSGVGTGLRVRGWVCPWGSLEAEHPKTY